MPGGKHSLRRRWSGSVKGRKREIMGRDGHRNVLSRIKDAGNPAIRAANLKP